MTTIWFTSDTHFGHRNIIAYQKRPFPDVQTMDETLIANWNERVKKCDVVYHLGDFALAFKTPDVEAYVRRLNGQIHLILGNHDHKATRKAAGFASMDYYREIKIGEQHIVLMHYAMKVWNKSHYGAWQLFGHSHGHLAQDLGRRHFDVGVDCWNYKPISYDEVAEEMKKHTFVPVDHHGRVEEDA